jgi:phosphoribosylformimino-5-aminoimidazole carboxamide ribotide isomerase
MRIIPAIDLIDGQMVRLTQGAFDRQTSYSMDPLNMALQFQESGLSYLHLVDLSGAKAGAFSAYELVREICQKTSLCLDVGGGLKEMSQIERLLNEGVRQVNIGSKAILEPHFLRKAIDRFGSERINLSLDIFEGKIAVNAWQDRLESSWSEFLASAIEVGLQFVTMTDISRDGMLTGPSFELYEQVLSIFPEIKLIASGGVSSIDDIMKLNNMNIDGVIVGKAIYEGMVSLEVLNDVD